MPFTHTHAVTFSSRGAILSSTSESVSADSEVAFDGTAVGSGTNSGVTEIDLAFTRANVKSLIILASAALSLKTNSSGAPDQTMLLAAGRPVVWKNTDQGACPIEDDITALFAVNASGTACTLLISILVDVTP